MLLLFTTDINDTCDTTADCGTYAECRDDGQGQLCLCEAGNIPADTTGCEPVGKLCSVKVRTLNKNVRRTVIKYVENVHYYHFICEWFSRTFSVVNDSDFD